MGRSRPKMWYGHGHTGRIGSYAYEMTITTLQSIRLEKNVQTVLAENSHTSKALNIEEPTLPRVHKAPRRYEIGSSSGVSPLSPENHYRTIYYETIDTKIVACIGDRFEQEGYQMYSKLEQMTIDKVRWTKLKS